MRSWQLIRQTIYREMKIMERAMGVMKLIEVSNRVLNSKTLGAFNCHFVSNNRVVQ